MPTYTVRAPNGKTYKITGPAGATNAQIERAVLEAYPDAGGAAPQSTAQRALANAKTDAQARLAQARRANDKSAEQTYSREVARLSKMTPQQFYKAPGRAESFVSGLVEGVTEPIELGLNLFGIGGDKAQRERGKFRLRESQRQFPGTTTAGEITGNILATAPGIAGAGGLITAGGKQLARVLPKAGASVQRIGTATRTGGIGAGRTPAQTAALTRGQRGLQLAERSLGGAIGGVTAAAQTGDDLTEAATFGAGLPVVANVVKRLGGKAVDLTRLSKVKAGKIIREALGEDVEAAKAAFRELSPDDQRLAQQVLVEAGVEPSPYFGLGKIATSQMDPDTSRRILEQQEAARAGRLAEAAGGGTMEDVRAAVRGGRAAVTEELAPLREEMYQRAGAASQIVPVAERTARQATQTADEITASGVVPRMRGLEERAGEQAAIMGDKPALFPDMERIQQTRGISGAAGQRADDAMAAQIELRGAANDLYQMVDDMASQGMRPMRAADLISSLRRKMADPEILRGSVEEGAIKGVIRQLEKATDANGMLNPKALGKIRRSGINTIVNRLSVQMGGVPSRTGTPEAAQGTVLELRSLIDDTLRNGGAGDLVDEFLQKSERGYAAVNRGELAGEALRLYKEDPSGTQFRALVGGDLPKTVGKIMKGGPESEKFRPAFAGDPRRLMALEKSAEELKTLNTMNELASAGQTRAQNILNEQQPGKLSRYAGTIVRAKYPALAFAGTGTQGAASAFVTPGVQREIANAFTSGQGALQAIEQYPTAAQFSAYLSTLPSPVRNAFAQAMRAYSQQPSSNAE
jgi:hypothetical protein